MSLLLLWTVLLGPHQDLWLCDLLSDGWHEQPLNEVVEAVAPTILVQLVYFPSIIMVYFFTIPFPPVCDLCNFSQIFTNRWLGTLQTWLELSSHWLTIRKNFLLRSLLLIPRTCLPAAAVYPLWAFSVPLPSVHDIGPYLCLLLLSFHSDSNVPSQYVTSQLSQLSLASVRLRGRKSSTSFASVMARTSHLAGGR